MTQVFINKGLRKDIPNDAVLLSRREALEIQWGIINNWKPKRDVWPFTLGLGLLASTTAATSLNLLLHYRNKLKLGNHGRITLALPNTLLPCLLSAIAHRYYVSHEVLLGEQCPLCIQTRAAVAQVCTVMVPLVATPIAAIYYADTYCTFNVPPLQRGNASRIFSLWLSLVTKYKLLPMVIGINAIAAAALTYCEADSFYKVQSLVYEKEERFKRMMAEK